MKLVDFHEFAFSKRKKKKSSGNFSSSSVHKKGKAEKLPQPVQFEISKGFSFAHLTLARR